MAIIPSSFSNFAGTTQELFITMLAKTTLSLKRKREYRERKLLTYNDMGMYANLSCA